MSKFVWHVRCTTCLRAAVYSAELDAQTWAATHRCPPSNEEEESDDAA